MTSMFAFTGMFEPHIKNSNLRLPENFDNYNPDQYPHFHVFVLAHICRPIDVRALEDNANIIAAIPEDEIKEVTFTQLIERGVVCGTGDLV